MVKRSIPLEENYDMLSYIKLMCLLCVATFLLNGCASLHTTERAAVVVFNDIDRLVNISFTLSGKQTSEETISVHEFKYIYEYEENPEQPILLPVSLTEIHINIAPACKLTLSRDKLTKLIHRDPEGRRTWDLHISDAFVKKLGC